MERLERLEPYVCDSFQTFKSFQMFKSSRGDIEEENIWILS